MSITALVRWLSWLTVVFRSIARVGAAEAHAKLSCFWGVAARFDRFISFADYLNFSQEHGDAHPAVDGDSGDELLGLRHIFFVVKASRARAEYAIRMYRTWLHATAQHVLLVDDVIDGLPKNSQIVVNDGRDVESRNAEGAHRDPVATSRLLIWMHQVKLGLEPGSLPPATRWIAFVGDDVYVNLARLFMFVGTLPPRADQSPVMFTHVMSNVVAMDFDAPCLNTGMAMVSRAALHRLSALASCKECPFVGNDDIALGYCSYFNAVPIVHVPHFHCHTDEQADDTLLSDLLAHNWVAAGGLSRSRQGQAADQSSELLLPYHPFEAEFPDFSCSLPLSNKWTVSLLFERVASCNAQKNAAAPVGRSPEPLLGGAVLDEDTLAEYFDGRWPGQAAKTAVLEVVAAWEEEAAVELAGSEAGALWQLLRQALMRSIIEGAEDGRWRFVRARGTWLHAAEVGRHIQALESSGLLASSGGQDLAVMFAFVEPGSDALDLRAGLLVNGPAAAALLRSKLHGFPTSTDIENSGIRVVHTPWMYPYAGALPQTLRGMVSEGAVSGAWSVGSLRSEDMAEEMEAAALNRRFFAGLLRENFEDWTRSEQGQAALKQGECGAAPGAGSTLATTSEEQQLAAARAFMKFLHNDDEHIEVVRGFKGGRREVRTLHAMYRSEASEGTLPTKRKSSSDTVLIARQCQGGTDE
eukprot:TRINITY_DN124926_c0_g1_i1.p1 TRINITY_DN124926_c0_g1~~TRINITY_DN124926_c0_g1_i1.p1  ORF type:complete len:696 (-),score=119.59 TRINITY_DN124926_c0_g1_i1:71-2158(-)